MIVPLVHHLVGQGEKDIVFRNAMAFYGQSRNWTPELALEPVDPRQFQR